MSRTGPNDIAVFPQSPAKVLFSYPAASLDVGAVPDGLAIGDLNGDGKGDLAALFKGSHQLLVYLQGEGGVIGKPCAGCK